MAEFTVSEVIDGDTFKVKNEWKWDNKTGDTVRPTGYNTPEESERGYEEAKRRLSNLILNKTVDIKNAKTIDDYGRLVADVYYRGKNLAEARVWSHFERFFKMAPQAGIEPATQ